MGNASSSSSSSSTVVVVVVVAPPHPPRPRVKFVFPVVSLTCATSFTRLPEADCDWRCAALVGMVTGSRYPWGVRARRVERPIPRLAPVLRPLPEWEVLSRVSEDLTMLSCWERTADWKLDCAPKEM